MVKLTTLALTPDIERDNAMSDLYSGAALAISIISIIANLGLGAYVAFRDRGHIVASGRKPEGPIFDAVLVHAVNTGRRPVTLRRLILKTRDGTSYERPLFSRQGNTVRLMESEDYEFRLDLLEDPDSGKWAATGLVSATLEDSRGKVYQAHDLAEIIGAVARKLHAPI